MKLQHSRSISPDYRHPAWISRFRARKRNGQRGIALLEAAVVTPIFLMVIMAIAEAGLYMRNYLGVSNTVRAGARASSAGGDNAAGALGTDVASADLYTVAAIARESSAISRSAIQYVVVYKATGYGAGPVDDGVDGVPAGCFAGQPRDGLCNVYTTADFDAAQAELEERTRHADAKVTDPTDVLDMDKMTFGCAPTSPDRYWCPNTRKSALNSNGGLGPDYVGVYMKVRHDWLTGIFGSSRYIADTSVIKIEPTRNRELP